MMPSLSGDPVDFTVIEGGSAYPRADYLANGHILGSYTDFPLGTEKQQLTLVTSTDNGKTWQLTGTAVTRSVNEGDLDNAYPLQLPSGRVVLAYRNHDKDDAGDWTIYRITLSYSDDMGANWEFLRDAVVVEATELKNDVWEPFLRNAQDGTLQLYYSCERSDDDQDNVLITSSDGGKTWGDEQPVSGGLKQTYRDGMLGVVQVSEGSLLAVFESSEKNGPFDINCISSSNGGVSWDKLEVFPIHTDWPGLVALQDEESFLYLAGHGGAKSHKVVLF